MRRWNGSTWLPGEGAGAHAGGAVGGDAEEGGIARAIVGRPRTLLWDEPTTGLDPVNTAAVERLIDQLSRELEVTSVIVTHDIEGGLLMCDRVAMLEGGRLRFCGTPAEFRPATIRWSGHLSIERAAEAALDVVDKMSQTNRQGRRGPTDDETRRPGMAPLHRGRREVRVGLFLLMGIIGLLTILFLMTDPPPSGGATVL